MSRRRQPSDYCGATKAITLPEAGKLGADHVIQVKHDGCYVTCYLDARGRACRVFLRNGTEAPRHLVGHLMGALVGAPHATLVGELEAMTDAGEAAAKLGPRRLHLFDILHDGQRSLVREPYRTRRAALERMHDAIDPTDDHRPAALRRYRDPVPSGFSLTPLIEEKPMSALADAWEQVLADDGEGLVIVALGAPVNRRPNKFKVKQTDQLDATVVQVARTTVIAEWRGVPFAVHRGRLEPQVGEVVSVSHNGWIGHSIPRHPRIATVRRDLV